MGNKMIEDHRKELPAHAVRQHIVNCIKQHPTLVIMGETGSGKSTQVPQLIYEQKLNSKGIIAISQTRRVAAISLAKRVSQEKSSQLGDLVGYAVRFENCTSDRTKIKYMTEGILLREAIRDKYLSKYSFVILDEAHERTSNTDVLFGVVKNAQKYRKRDGMNELGIIIMSATIDVTQISKYFNECPVLYLPGRSFKVHVSHAKQKQDDFLFASLVTLFNIHSSAPINHDVLIFLPGKEEIDSMIHQIRSVLKSPDLNGKSQMKVWPLHSALTPQKQMEVFQKCNDNFRRVIVATNIAETSLTIPGIKYVIDSGVFKMKNYEATTGLESLKISKISQAQAWQRSGRAGRESEGYCYRTYTIQQFNNMEKAIKPEILRCNLSSLILQLLTIGIDVKNFEFIDEPPKQSMSSALRQLKQLGAIKTTDNPQLTDIGHKMSHFPLDPTYSKVIISAPQYKCLEEVLDLVSILSTENIFCDENSNNRDQAVVQHSKFKSNLGDHFTLLNVFSQFKNHRENKWCHDNFLNPRSLQYAYEIRKQLEEICENVGMQTTKHKSSQCNTDNLRKCLLTGFFNNIAEQKVHDKHYIVQSSRQKAQIHPSSILSGYHGIIAKNGNGISITSNETNNKIKDPSKSNYVIFNEIVDTSQVYLRIVTKIEPEWIEEILGMRNANSS